MTHGNKVLTTNQNHEHALVGSFGNGKTLVTKVISTSAGSHLLKVNPDGYTQG